MVGPAVPPDPAPDSESGAASAPMPSLLEVGELLTRHWRSLLVVPLLAGALAIAATFLVKPTFTSQAALLPPSLQPVSMAGLFGGLGGFAGAVTSGIPGLKDPNEQWVAILRGRTVADVLIDRFKLVQLYGVEFRFEARTRLAANTRIEAGKHGLVMIDVDDHDPLRAQAMVLTYVEQAQRLADEMAVTESAKRRGLFERQLAAAAQRLSRAEADLQGTGIRPDVLKGSPDAAVAEMVAVQHQILEAEVQIAAMRSTFSDTSAQLAQPRARLGQLQRKLESLKQSQGPSGGDKSAQGYLARYRDFRYAEELYASIAKQYELARLDEARQGAPVQIIDAPSLPEWKSKPKRLVVGVFSGLAAALLMLVWVWVTFRLDQARRTSDGAAGLKRLRDNLRWRRPRGGDEISGD